MTTWTERLPVAFPESLIDQANALAAIIDPDTGGYLTFDPAQNRGGYCYASIPFKAEFEPLVRRRDPDEWQYAIAQLASEKGMEIMPWDTVEALRASMLIGDECDVLTDEIQSSDS